MRKMSQDYHFGLCLPNDQSNGTYLLDTRTINEDTVTEMKQFVIGILSFVLVDQQHIVTSEIAADYLDMAPQPVSLL